MIDIFIARLDPVWCAIMVNKDFGVRFTHVKHFTHRQALNILKWYTLPHLVWWCIFRTHQLSMQKIFKVQILVQLIKREFHMVINTTFSYWVVWYQRIAVHNSKCTPQSPIVSLVDITKAHSILKKRPWPIQFPMTSSVFHESDVNRWPPGALGGHGGVK